MEFEQDVVETLVQHARAGDLEAFMAQGEGCGWCRHPVQVQGKRTCIYPVTAKRVVVFDTRSLPDGVVLKACGNRRETRCPSCSAVYRDDARNLVRAGLEGGAHSDEDHSHRPGVLLTLTAPSFGAVHRSTASGAPCRPGSPSKRCPHGRRLFCFDRHDDAEESVGTPLCPDCYDYEGAVLHNAVVPELWRRTSIYLPRCLARVMGLTQAQCRRCFRISYLRVAEFQRRGTIHLHVIVRLDCLAGEELESSAAHLATACLAAVGSVGVMVAGRTHRWGTQADVAILERDESRAGRSGCLCGQVRDQVFGGQRFPRPAHPKRRGPRPAKTSVPRAAPRHLGLGPWRQRGALPAPSAAPCPSPRLRRPLPVQVETGRPSRRCAVAGSPGGRTIGPEGPTSRRDASTRPG